MRALPFLTAPAAPSTRIVGNAHSGTLRIPVLGGITVQESAYIDELLASKPNAFVEAAKVADGIAKQEGLTLVEAFTVIERAVGGVTQEADAEELRIKHAAAIDRVVKVFAASNRHTTEAAVTALLRFRLDLPEWDPSDTRGLRRRLRDDIYALYRDELEAEDSAPAPVGEEELGKPQRGSGSPRKRTGSKSPTTSSTTSPASTTA